MQKKIKRNSNDKEMFSKVSISWYPGHMAKTRKQIEEDLKLIDVVIELLDSRIPIASRNPDIRKLTQNKNRIIILNKCDLSDEQVNKKWVEKLSKEAPVLLTDANTGKGIDKVSKKIEDLMKEEIARQAARGRINKTIRVMILGIPNVGKSSFINRIAKKNKLEVGNKPGVTKSKQWIRIGKNQELLDTPGVLWPKFETQEIALNLAYTGTIKDEILDNLEIAYNLLKYLLNNYRNKLIEAYKLDNEQIEEILKNENQMENENIMDIMGLIGKKRGAIISGGNIDENKTANIIIKDFREAKIGKITLEPYI